MENKSPFFTIFTAVYNAEAYLHRVFDSVLQQTLHDFEWIIIDDGSKDGSAEIIEQFLAEHPAINAIFIKQENGGKHSAWNKAVSIAKGTLFVPADADDSFIPSSLAFFYNQWHSFTIEQRLKLSGINVLCFDNDSENIVGNYFPKDGMWSNNLELYFKLGLKGEKWGCVRVDLLKKRTFPIVQGYYPESFLWFYLAKHYQAVCYNVPLRRYFTTSTGLMASNRISKISTNQAKIYLKHYGWFFSNFGLYALKNSPLELFRTVYIYLLYLWIVLKRKILSIK